MSAAPAKMITLKVMSAAPAKMITLKSSDEQLFVIEKTTASQSETLENMMSGKETENIVIPLTTITGSILAKVIEYCNKHAEIETSDEDKKIWDAQFVNLYCTDTLLEITAAANFLKINGLLDLTSEKVGDKILYMAPEEICRIFNIENEFTTKEEKEESQWASDIMDMTSQEMEETIPYMAPELIRHIFNFEKEITTKEEEKSQ